VHGCLEGFVGAEWPAQADVERAVAGVSGVVEDAGEPLREWQVGVRRRDGAVGGPPGGDTIKFRLVFGDDWVEITDGIEDILDEELALVVEALDVNART
jgi:hypothetical protein